MGRLQEKGRVVYSFCADFVQYALVPGEEVARSENYLGLNTDSVETTWSDCVLPAAF